MLKILNERTYDVGDGVARQVPLKLCVAASNEWASPDSGQELAALSDRFLLRKEVEQIRTRAGRQRLLWSRGLATGVSATITTAEVEQAQRDAAALPWSADAKEALERILSELAKEGIRPGDRRQFKTVGAVQAYAYLCGATDVRPEHLEVARHCLWDVPGEQPRKTAEVIARVANPAGMRVTQLLLEVEGVLAVADPGTWPRPRRPPPSSRRSIGNLPGWRAATAASIRPATTSKVSSRNSSSPPSRPCERHDASVTPAGNCRRPNH